MDSFTIEHRIATTFAGRCDQGDVLVCCRDARNRHDPFAFATCKIIGHVRSLNNTVHKTFMRIKKSCFRIKICELVKHLANFAKFRTSQIKPAVRYK